MNYEENLGSGSPSITIDLSSDSIPASINLALGDEFLLEGDENPGTAYIWFVKESDHYEVINDEVEEGNGNGMLGG